MLDVGSSELLLIVIVAIVVIGPKDLPRVLYKLGQLIGKGRAMTRHFRSGIDEMIRQAEMEEMEKKWAADNARIMAQTQQAPVDTTEGVDAAPPALPAPDPSVAEHGVSGTAPVADKETPAFRVDPAQVEIASATDHLVPDPNQPSAEAPAKTLGGSAA
ncbi:MAG: Sec-independent protein translocase protein TatB [Sphingobium sp.]